MIYTIALYYNTNNCGRVIMEEEFLPVEERQGKYTVLGLQDHYYSDELKGGYEVFEVEAEKPTDIIKLIDGEPHRLIEYTDEGISWEPIEE